MQETGEDVGVDMVFALFGHSGNEPDEGLRVQRGEVGPEDGDEGLEDQFRVLLGQHLSLLQQKSNTEIQV